MAYGYIIENQMAAHDVKSYVKAAVAASNVDGGVLVSLGAYSNGAFTVTPATSGQNLYIAKNPAQHLVKVGTKVVAGGEISKDPRDFTNLASYPFNVEAVKVGDMVTFTAGNIASGVTPAVGNLLEYTATGYNVVASATTGNTTFKVVAVGTQPVPQGGIGHEKMATYMCMAIQA